MATYCTELRKEQKYRQSDVTTSLHSDPRFSEKDFIGIQQMFVNQTFSNFKFQQKCAVFKKFPIS